MVLGNSDKEGKSRAPYSRVFRINLFERDLPAIRVCACAKLLLMVHARIRRRLIKKRKCDKTMRSVDD